MRLVMATILPAQVESVRQALAEVQVTRLSVADAHRFHDGRLAQVAVLEIAVNEDFLERTVSTISRALGAAGPDGDELAADGVPGLCIMPMEETIQIYRAVRGQEAI